MMFQEKSLEFEQKIPISLNLILQIDNVSIEKGFTEDDYAKHGVSKRGLNQDVLSTIIEIYQEVADLLMEADGDISKNENADYNTYIGMLTDFVNNNSIRRSSVSGFTKKTGNSSAPTKSESIINPVKSGVSAPRKKG